MNIKKLALSSSESKLLGNIIRKDSREQISGSWTMFFVALFFTIVFYVFSTIFEYNPEDLTVSRLIDFIYGPSKLLQILKEYPPTGFFHTIFDYPMTYFLWLVFQIPHTVMTVFFFYNVFISFYLPFKTNYSIRDFLEWKEDRESLLKDTPAITSDSIASIDTNLSEEVWKNFSLENEIAKIKLSLSKKDFLKTDEINSLTDELSEKENLIEEGKRSIESLKGLKDRTQRTLDLRKKLEKEIDFLTSLVEDLRLKQLS